MVSALLFVAALGGAPPAGEPAPQVERHGMYAQLGAVGISLPIQEPYWDTPDFLWGLGAGYRYRGPLGLVVAAGLDVTHEPVVEREDYVGDEAPPMYRRRAHAFSLVPCVRLGGALNDVLGYGTVGIGMAGYRADVYYGDELLGTESDVGWATRLGFGIQILIRRRFAVGVELAFESHHFELDADLGDDYPYELADYEGELKFRAGVVASWGW